MKSNHVERLLRGERQEPAVVFGKIFRSQTTSSATRFGQYRDGMDFTRKATVESTKLIPCVYRKPCPFGLRDQIA